MDAQITRNILPFALFVLICNSAAAADFNVTKTTDTWDGSCTAQDCSLREAIIAANNTLGLDTVVLPAGTYFITIGGRGDSQGLTGDFDITDDVAIVGVGNVTVNGGGLDRIFDFAALNGSGQQQASSITNIHMTNGNPGFDLGGAVENGGFLFIEDSVISGNTAEIGGGISQEVGASMIIAGTTIESNTANDYGGGIDNVEAELLLAGVLVYDNQAGTEGGGIDNTDGYFELFTSTITGNTSNTGGGIENFNGILIGGSSTIANNTANQGGGVLSSAFSQSNITGLIIANNNGGNCFGALISTNYNLDSGQSCGLSQGNDQINTDPMLGALQFDGGPVKVLPLLDGSPAIDAGGVGCPLEDQRGQSRPQDGDGDGDAQCDIGAYEKEESMEDPPFDGEIIGPSIRVGDIDNDGIDDIATLRREEMGFDNLIYLHSGVDGTLIRTQSTGSPEPIDMKLVPDANGDGIDDLAILQKENGVVDVWVQDMTEPNPAMDEISVVSFAPANDPKGLVAYAGLNGESWIGVLGVKANNDVRLQLKRANGTGGTVGNYTFAPSFPPEFIDIVPDITGDGIAEIAVLGIDAGGNIRVQLKNGATGALIHWIQFAKAFTPIQMVIIPSTDAGPGIGVLQKHADGRVRIQTKYAETRMPIGTGAINFAQSFDPMFALALPDKTGNGYTELGVFGIRGDKAVRIQMKDSVTKQGAGEVFFSKLFPPKSVFYLGDIDNNNAFEIGSLGQNTNNFNIKIQVKDSATKQEQYSVAVP